MSRPRAAGQRPGPRGFALGVALSALLSLSGARADAPDAPEAAGAQRLVLPGAPPLPDGVRGKIEAALAHLPDGYRPRTRHRRADGSPVYSNRLLLEESPYLRQHSHNPVNWYPWGDEAFEAAARLGRPVLVSIGYSTCHWCHVMEDESFDDVETAEFLNQHFIAIKVDREARPDIDAIYMKAVHLMGQRGGWPLNVWVTPEREPFFGGTYFPPETRPGRPSFVDVLGSIRKAFAEQRTRIDESAAKVAAALRTDLEGQPHDGGPGAAVAGGLGSADLDRAWLQTLAAADREWGGIGQRTKFPSSTPLRFLLRYFRRAGSADALAFAVLTLEKMAAGGIHDHVGGGFHRYSTDPQWLVPHFEKMLYDNALLATAYLEASQVTGRTDFARIARAILDYVTREMTSPQGAFYSATDADSLDASGEAGEGTFFTWTPDEMQAALGADRGRLLSAWYGVSQAGSYEGRSVLHTWRDAASVAAELETPIEGIEPEVARSTMRLRELRQLRPAPLRDEKVLAAWNGLMISAFARAGLALDEPRYIETATRAVEFVLTQMRSGDRLVRVHGEGGGGAAFLEDYAFMIAGLLDLYESDSRPRWLREAVALQAVLDRHYADAKRGGYFRVADDQPVLLAREKPIRDGALPSGNSVAVSNLQRLAEFSGDDAYEKAAEAIFAAVAEDVRRAPLAFGHLLLALDFALDPRVEIVLVSPVDGKGREAMLAPLRSAFLPNRVITVVTQDEALVEHALTNPLVSGRIAQRGETTAYLCRDRICGFPTNDPPTFAKQLRELERASLDPAQPALLLP